MLILAFDTATDVATSALVGDGELLGERVSIAQTVLEDIDALLRQASARPRDLDGLVVGTGPGSFTSTRIGLAVARGLGLALGVPGAGVSTLDALAAGGGDGARAVIDARRGEVFVEGPRACLPSALDVEASVLVGNGAVRHRELFEARGARVPPDDDPRHLPRAELHARIATELGPLEAIEPIYVRQPDVGRTNA
ncbi:MAG: tRNA (adenosine(37)-N6)-threonylcarbamoyltransferase complex dimerization subunit type 1 TsaB [Actinobacteria bacterium]|nr:tRNA (adenosine(37)-N6)-threonylcarbamoyltransferase complex dimerization subunit type 1 TsaB [Actinomycetota bacterium]